ncbi:MAG TPA: flagellar hook-associated protein FlgK [Ktedonobacterales bacterium]|nr:flagellar hook-associated protein FlgK [Ktedonobacterales bacterium]
MSSIFMALNTANSGLQADQASIETIDHNVSNANTPGYSQQTAHLVASPAYTAPSLMRAAGPGQFGTGVTVQNVIRARDSLLDGQYRYQNQLAGQWSTLDTQYTQVQGILQEPSTTGLNAKLTAFWNNWQQLADDPTNIGARAGLQQSAIALTTTFNNDAQQLTEAQQTADNAVTNAVNTVNNLTTQIANLNGQIRSVIATGQQPNDLLDQRDLLIDQLSNAVPITYAAQPDGTVTINLATQVPGTTTLALANPGEASLVSATTTNTLTYASTGGTPAYTSPTFADGHPLVDPVAHPGQTLIGGQLGAALQMRDTILGGGTGLISQLDNIVKQVVQNVNTLHDSASAYDLNGNNSMPFFNIAGGASGTAPAIASVTAANVVVNAPIVNSPTAIAASATQGAVGDGSVAQAIADTVSQKGAPGDPLPNVRA